jgi:hypothetical protein
MIFTHLADQIDKVGIDLVLQQTGARRGALVADGVSINQNRPDALSGEPVGHKGARYTGAHNKHFARLVS